MAWVTISDSEKLQDGVTYRSVYQIRAPYNDTLVSVLEGAINVGNTINNIDAVNGLHATVDIQSMYAVPPTVSTHDPTEKLPWEFIIEYTPKAGRVDQAGVGDVISFIGPILLALAFLIAVVGHYSQKLATNAETVLNTITDDAKKVFSPGVILAGFIVLVLFLRR